MGKKVSLFIIGLFVALALLVNFFKVTIGITGVSLLIYGIYLMKKFKGTDIVSAKPFWYTYLGIWSLLMLFLSFVGKNNVALSILCIALLVLPIFFIIGLIKPGISLKFSKIKTKKHSALVYGITTLLAFSSIGFVAPDLPKVNTITSQISSVQSQKQDKKVASSPVTPSLPASTTPSVSATTPDASNNTQATSGSSGSIQSTSQNSSGGSSTSSGSVSVAPAPAPNPTPTPAPAPTPKPSYSVEILYVSSPVSRNSTATLRARVTPGATATIVVNYKSGPSKAAGLGPQTAGSDGIVTWSWKVGGNTTTGSWPITVSCNGQSETTYFTVQ